MTVPRRTAGSAKLSPAAVRRAKQLHDAGLSTRKIAAALASEGLGDVAHTSVLRLLQRDAPAEVPPPLPDEDVDVGALTLPDGAPLEALASRLSWVRGLLAGLEPRIQRGEVPIAQVAGLVRLEVEIARRVVELTPPTPADPSKDPTNLAARAMIHAQVVGLIEAAAARVGRLCFRCRAEVTP